MENTTTMTVTARNQALQHVALQDDLYSHLRGVHFNNRHAIATDGHMVVIARKHQSEPENTTIEFDKPTIAGKAVCESYQQVGQS